MATEAAVVAAVAAKAAAVASATGSAIVLLVVIPVVSAAARFDPIAVLTVVGTTGDDGSVVTLVFVALRYCSLLTNALYLHLLRVNIPIQHY